MLPPAESASPVGCRGDTCLFFGSGEEVDMAYFEALSQHLFEKTGQVTAVGVVNALDNIQTRNFLNTNQACYYSADQLYNMEKNLIWM
jgi:hypothetical protein